MTGSGWLAIGAVLASLIGRRGDPGALVLLATALAVALAGLRRGGAAPNRIRLGLTVAVGALLIAIRLALGAGSTTATPLPDGDRPWIAEVVAISSPRDGQQVATLTLVASSTADDSAS